MATSSPKRAQRVKPKTYSTCLLYNSKEAKQKLAGITLASCNRSIKPKLPDEEIQEPETITVTEPLQLTVSDKMSCNYCDATFLHRLDQKRHYRSDWHRYNLKQRLKGRDKVTEELFEDISGNISSLSGSDSDSDNDTDTDQQTRPGSGRKLPGSPRRLIQSGNTSTDSESESGNQPEDIARRLPKVYFRNGEGEILSVYRCVLYHKKSHPSQPEDLVTMATSLPDHMYWAVFMAAGGHFAGAVFNKNEMVAHKTFHRYVVRAKRGTAQGSRDSQGNAPKSAGASLRRYNEAALTQDIQDLILSWKEYIKQCDRIFLRAPSFNRKIFFSGKSPPFSKDDQRIRLIPFQTRRPTFNEARRVYEMLASIECYGDEADMQDLVPMSPPQVFNPETGQLIPKDENQLSPRQRKLMNKKLGTSPLALEESKTNSDSDQKACIDSKATEKREPNLAVPGHVIEEDIMSSGTSTASDTELVETMATINLLELKEFAYTKKPKKKKKSARKRKPSLRCQTEPEMNVMEEEKYHLKNSLYTACKVGDKDSLKNLLAILFNPQIITEKPKNTSENDSEKVKTDAGENEERGELLVSQSAEMSLESCKNEGVGGDIENTQQISSEVRTSESSIIVNRQSKSCTVNNLIGDNSNFKKSYSDKESVEPLNCRNINDMSKVERCLGESGLETFSSKDAENVSVEEVEMVSALGEGNTKMDQNNLERSHSSDRTDHKYENNELGNENSTDVVNEAKQLESCNISSEKSALSLDTSSTSVSVPGTWPDFSPVVTAGLLSEPFGDNSTTFLHIAAKEGHGAVVRILMEAGANPAVRDKGGLTPYMVSRDKATRNEFRRFMGKWPDRYDYDKAQIPLPLTEEMENERKKKEAERKKANKKIKQEQQRVKRELEEKQQAEEREKQRFVNLSDREKRALAAEKRLVSQVTSQGAEKPILCRCFQCGADMTGKVPFEYFENKFCTSKCLQLHRKSVKKS